MGTFVVTAISSSLAVQVTALPNTSAMHPSTQVGVAVGSGTPGEDWRICRAKEERCTEAVYKRS
jgi:hypothetical protein